MISEPMLATQIGEFPKPRPDQQLSVDAGVVVFTGTVAEPEGAVLRVDRSSLRFLDVAPLDVFLAGAGFEVEGRYGDWRRGPVDDASREIVTVARARPLR